MGQNKFVELRIAQFHWNDVPRLGFRHLDPESIEILADSSRIDKTRTCKGFQPISWTGKTCNQLTVYSLQVSSSATFKRRDLRSARTARELIDLCTFFQGHFHIDRSGVPVDVEMTKDVLRLTSRFLQLGDKGDLHYIAGKLTLDEDSLETGISQLCADETKRFDSVTLALAFALVAAALGVWLAKGPEFAPFFAACGAVGFLLFACSRAGRGAGQLQRRLIRPFALALGRESYGIYLWHFICTYASFHVFDHSFGQANKATSLALFIVTITATLIVSYGLSRISHQLIQARASRFSRTLLARVDTYFSPR